VFEAARTESLPDHLRREIEQAIRSGRIAPGERLPSERELALQFAVSRVVVREALRSLEATGTIEIRRNRGAFVRRTPSQSLHASWTAWLAANRVEVIELLTLRRVLESLAAGEAARLREPGDLSELTRMCDAFERELAKPGSSVERLVELDILFHRRIALAAGGTLLPKLVGDLVRVLRDPPATFATPGRAEITATDHRRVLAAIRAGDADAASAALSDHLTHIMDLVVQLTPDDP
jgi:GntR family transcriptional repressor for pyruvate dehydrogenase complex